MFVCLGNICRSPAAEAIMRKKLEERYWPNSPVKVDSAGIGSWHEGQLPDSLYANLLTAYLGFPGPGFYSTDYFSLIPWLFLFWAGFYLYKVVGRPRMEPLRRSICPPLGWIGRHSLVIYMLHQPVLYGLLMVWNALH